MEAYLQLDAFPEAKGALAALAAYRLAILSNGTARMLQALVERAGLVDSFSHLISVDEVRTYKPRPEVYQLAVRRLGVEKEAIGFVSSNYWDAVGAKSFGFPAFWVNRTGAAPDVLGLVPDRTITTLADLPAAIRG
jgi:2-haloacid dehalogenase